MAIVAIVDVVVVCIVLAAGHLLLLAPWCGSVSHGNGAAAGAADSAIAFVTDVVAVVVAAVDVTRRKTTIDSRRLVWRARARRTPDQRCYRHGSFPPLLHPCDVDQR